MPLFENLASHSCRNAVDFYSTYKELKHPYLHLVYGGYIIFTLPIRN
ncbi:MAG: hypothetical protein J7J10_02905 [Deltaproteobacteria bacterium]|nr:hypothetical protein [Deltaproteobacteria bacterium]